MSTQVQNLAESLDEFLSDKEYENERNDTEIRLRFDLDMSSDKSPEFRFRPRVRLRLPHTEQVFLLDFGGNRNGDGREAGGDGFLSDSEDQNDVSAVRLRIPNEVGDVRITPETGIGFAGNGATFFAGVRFSRTWDINEDFLVFASQRFRAHTDRGGEAKTYLRLDRELDSRSLFRSEMKLEWRDDRAGWLLRPGLILRHAFSDDSVLSWENFVSFKTSSDLYTDSAFTGLRYRRLIYRDWLFGEVVPWLGSEHKDTGREFVQGVRLRIDVNF